MVNFDLELSLISPLIFRNYFIDDLTLEIGQDTLVINDLSFGQAYNCASAADATYDYFIFSGIYEP